MGHLHAVSTPLHPGPSARRGPRKSPEPRHRHPGVGGGHRTHALPERRVRRGPAVLPTGAADAARGRRGHDDRGAEGAEGDDGLPRAVGDEPGRGAVGGGRGRVRPGALAAGPERRGEEQLCVHDVYTWAAQLHWREVQSGGVCDAVGGVDGQV